MGNKKTAIGSSGDHSDECVFQGSLGRSQLTMRPRGLGAVAHICVAVFIAASIASADGSTAEVDNFIEYDTPLNHQDLLVEVEATVDKAAGDKFAKEALRLNNNIMAAKAYAMVAKYKVAEVRKLHKFSISSAGDFFVKIAHRAMDAKTRAKIKVIMRSNKKMAPPQLDLASQYHVVMLNLMKKWFSHGGGGVGPYILKGIHSALQRGGILKMKKGLVYPDAQLMGFQSNIEEFKRDLSITISDYNKALSQLQSTKFLPQSKLSAALRSEYIKANPLDFFRALKRQDDKLVKEADDKARAKRAAAAKEKKTKWAAKHPKAAAKEAAFKKIAVAGEKAKDAALERRGKIAKLNEKEYKAKKKAAAKGNAIEKRGGGKPLKPKLVWMSGGCKGWALLKNKAMLTKKAYDLQSCARACALKKWCWGFFLGSGGPDKGKCAMVTKGCKNDGNRNWTYYQLPTAPAKKGKTEPYPLAKKEIVKLITIVTKFEVKLPISRAQFASKKAGIEADMAKRLGLPKSDVAAKVGKAVTPVLVRGATVALQGGRHGKYCSDEGHSIKCNRSKIKQWEQFSVVDLGGDKVALKGGRHGKFCADEGAGGVKCNRGHVKGWEKFSVVELVGGKVAFRGGQTGKYCADEGNKIKCDRNHKKKWEQFKVTCLKGCNAKAAYAAEADAIKQKLAARAARTTFANVYDATKKVEAPTDDAAPTAIMLQEGAGAGLEVDFTITEKVKASAAAKEKAKVSKAEAAAQAKLKKALAAV